MTLFRDHAMQARTASGVNTLLGLWLIFSPVVFPFAAGNSASAWNSEIVGALITVLGAARAFAPRQHPGLSWINLALGAWTAMSPWIFGYLLGAQMWNSLFVGLVIIALAVCSGSATEAEQHQSHA
jgi:hypothetical protein